MPDDSIAPSEVAAKDQMKAEAIDRLRTCDSFIVFAFREDENISCDCGETGCAHVKYEMWTLGGARNSQIIDALQQLQGQVLKAMGESLLGDSGA